MRIQKHPTEKFRILILKSAEMLYECFGFFVLILSVYADFCTHIVMKKLSFKLYFEPLCFISKYIFLLKTNRFGKYIEIVKQQFFELNFVGFVLKY